MKDIFVLTNQHISDDDRNRIVRSFGFHNVIIQECNYRDRKGKRFDHLCWRMLHYDEVVYAKTSFRPNTTVTRLFNYANRMEKPCYRLDIVDCETLLTYIPPFHKMMNPPETCKEVVI